MKTLLSVAFFLLLFFIAVMQVQWQQPHPAYKSLCEMVGKHYFRQDQKLNQWRQQCINRSLKYSYQNHDELIQRLRWELSLLGGSHLSLYEPVAFDRMWEGKSTGDTGIRARFVDGELVIYDILSGSVAEQAGLKVGAYIQSIDGEHPNESSVQSQAGVYKVLLPNGKEDEIVLNPATLQLDERPYLEELTSEIGLLRIPSFRGDFFKQEDFEELIDQAEAYKALVIDLRDNMGGNLVAGLRLLGALLCKDQTIGSLSRSRSESEQHGQLENNLSDHDQITQISALAGVDLNSFPQKKCIQSELITLIDHGSASTAEIVAQGLLDNKRSLIWGTPSAGQVLVALWYGFPELGEGYSISIPEWQFVSISGEELEGRGVHPERTLYYQLQDLRLGKDTWVLEAVEALKKAN